MKMGKILAAALIISMIFLISCSNDKIEDIPSGDGPEQQEQPAMIDPKIEESLLLSVEGVDLFKQNNPEEAMKKFDESLSKNKNNALAHIGKGYILTFVEREYTQAQESFRKGLELSSDDMQKTNVYIGLSTIEVFNNNYAMALIYLKNASAYEENNNQKNVILVLYGKVHRLTNEYESAINVLNEAKEEFPSDSRAYEALGNVYIDIEEYEKAFENLKKAIELDSEKTDNYHSMARYYESIGNLQMASEYIDISFTKGYDEYNSFISIDEGYALKQRIQDQMNN